MIRKTRELMHLMQYSERTKAAQDALLTVLNDKECTADSKKLFDTLDTCEPNFSMFEYLNAKMFAWSAVISDELTEINSRLDRIEAMLKEDSDSTNDSDINIGGF